MSQLRTQHHEEGERDGLSEIGLRSLPDNLHSTTLAKGRAETVVQLAQRRDEIHHGWRGGMPEVRVAGSEVEGRALEIDVDSVETVLADNAADLRNEVRHRIRAIERDVHAATTERNHHLLALTLQIRDNTLELPGVGPAGRAELKGAFRRIPIRCGEGMGQ